MKTISEHIAMRLAALNATHPKINVNVNGNEHLGDTIEKLNGLIDKVSVELDGKDFDANNVAKIPNPFKKSPMVWQCLGTDLALEVSF